MRNRSAIWSSRFLSVTVLSTIAMVIYPMLAQLFQFDARDSGLFLGGTIHDVAQVVGAGFSIGPETGETATLVKLIRVSMLAPVVLVFSLVIRQIGLSGAHPKDRPAVDAAVRGWISGSGGTEFLRSDPAIPV